MEPEGEQPQRGTGGENAGSVAALLSLILMNRELRRAQLRRLPRLTQAGTLLKNVIGGVAGNVLEWYDFAVFGYFAPQIGEQFFPAADPLSSLLAAFGVFAAAYLVRPIGGILFGRIGDRLGRKRALQLSVMMMAGPTFLIGLLPTYASIGEAAPALLVLLRIGQGLSIGGELIGSISFVTESAPARRRGFFSSWTFASCYGGMALGSLSAVWLDAALGPKAVMSWGWRLPFLAGIFIGLAGIWMRRELEETPVFTRMKAAGALDDSPVAEAVRLAPMRIFHASALVVLLGGGFYLLFVWWPTLLTRYVHPHVHQALALNTVSMLVLVVLIPLVGRASDAWGRKPFLVASCAGLMLASLPLFMLVRHGELELVAIAQLSFTLLMAGFIGPIAATLVEMFPARLRNSAMGLSYNISLSIFGGSAPLVATWLVRHYRSVTAPGVYLTVLAALNLLAAMSLPVRRSTVGRRATRATTPDAFSRRAPRPKARPLGCRS